MFYSLNKTCIHLPSAGLVFLPIYNRQSQVSINLRVEVSNTVHLEGATLETQRVCEKNACAQSAG